MTGHELNTAITDTFNARIISLMDDCAEEEAMRLMRLSSFPVCLRGQFMVMAQLRGACLRNADLSGADLRSADLRNADLSGADLSGADLRNACLSGANLDGANLDGANLRDVRGADLSSLID